MDNGAGNLFGEQEINVTVREVNVAPTLTVTPVTTTSTGLSFTASGQDIDLVAGVPNALIYFSRWSTIGVTIDPVSGVFSWTPNAAQFGTYTFCVRVTDNGTPVLFAEHDVTITTLGVVDGVLMFVGTASDDAIVFSPASNGGITASLNGNVIGSFSAPISQIIAHGLAGNDDIQIAGSTSIGAWLYGDGGNDRLKGSGGHDVLLGGDDDDLLVGGSGRDLLIGGLGADRLVGNQDDDILIAGFTAYDAHREALRAVLSEWTRTDISYENRVANLTNGGGHNGNYCLDGATVGHDDSADVLTGNSGLDSVLFHSAQGPGNRSSRRGLRNGS